MESESEVSLMSDSLHSPWTAAHQALPSMGFSRQEYWSGLPFPSPMYESEKWKWSRLVVSNSVQPHRQQPTRLLHPWDFPGKSIGVGCHCLLRIWSITCKNCESLCCIPELFFNLFWSLFHKKRRFKEIARRRQWQPTPILLPGKSHGWRSLVGCSPWGR